MHSVLAWLLAALGSLGATATVGGGGPIAKSAVAHVVSAPAVGGGGPIAR